jgi:hypothetical protein
VGGAAARAASQAHGPAKAPPAPVEEISREWYLYYNDAQFGPFSQEEVERLLRSGRINLRVHAWTAGMDAWSRLMKVAAFQTVVAEVQAKEEQKLETPTENARTAHAPAVASSVVREQRKSPRAPMTARLLMSDQRQVFDALCRDVSTGGMQVLTSKTPGKVGDRIRLNITPGVRSDIKPRHDSALKPFVAEGLIVRLLEDGRGFSFRFEKLAPEARLAIEEFVQEESRSG